MAIATVGLLLLHRLRVVGRRRRHRRRERGAHRHDGRAQVEGGGSCARERGPVGEGLLALPADPEDTGEEHEEGLEEERADLLPEDAHHLDQQRDAQPLAQRRPVGQLGGVHTVARAHDIPRAAPALRKVGGDGGAAGEGVALERGPVRPNAPDLRLDLGRGQHLLLLLLRLRRRLDARLVAASALFLSLRGVIGRLLLGAPGRGRRRRGRAAGACSAASVCGRGGGARLVLHALLAPPALLACCVIGDEMLLLMNRRALLSAAALLLTDELAEATELGDVPLVLGAPPVEHSEQGGDHRESVVGARQPSWRTQGGERGIGGVGKPKEHAFSPDGVAEGEAGREGQTSARPWHAEQATHHLSVPCQHRAKSAQDVLRGASATANERPLDVLEGGHRGRRARHGVMQRGGIERHIVSRSGELFSARVGSRHPATTQFWAPGWATFYLLALPRTSKKTCRERNGRQENIIKS